MKETNLIKMINQTRLQIVYRQSDPFTYLHKLTSHIVLKYFFFNSLQNHAASQLYNQNDIY